MKLISINRNYNTPDANSSYYIKMFEFNIIGKIKFKLPKFGIKDITPKLNLDKPLESKLYENKLIEFNQMLSRSKQCYLKLGKKWILFRLMNKYLVHYEEKYDFPLINIEINNDILLVNEKNLIDNLFTQRLINLEHLRKLCYELQQFFKVNDTYIVRLSSIPNFDFIKQDLNVYFDLKEKQILTLKNFNINIKHKLDKFDKLKLDLLLYNKNIKYFHDISIKYARKLVNTLNKNKTIMIYKDFKNKYDYFAIIIKEFGLNKTLLQFLKYLYESRIYDVNLYLLILEEKYNIKILKEYLIFNKKNN